MTLPPLLGTTPPDPKLNAIVKSGVLQARSNTGEFAVRDGRLVDAAPGPARVIWFSMNDLIEPSIGLPRHLLKNGLEESKGDMGKQVALVDLLQRKDAWR